MRKMATIRKIDAINPIPDADAIEVATVGGWNVVIKKGEFSVGDLAVYCEIDSWIPNTLAPFLSKGQEPREYNGVKGERLRTVKLRGQVSQGLLLNPTVIHESAASPNNRVFFNFSNRWAVGICENDDGDQYTKFFFEGDDVSELLKIQKYEAPIPAQLAGEARGVFPGFIPKTDQERIQNLTREFADWKTLDFTWEVTEKLDGSSMTVYVMDDDVGVCSRNLNLRESDTNSLWRVARATNLIEKIKSTGRNLALQGELVGEGIQGNRYKVKGQRFFLFDIYDITRGDYLSPRERNELATSLNIDHVPVLDATRFINTDTVESLLNEAEAKSVLCPSAEREGVVFKSNQMKESFKVISNKFLLKGGE